MENMTLKGYYDSLSAESPQLRFKKNVIVACDISNSTFYNWFQGRWPVPDDKKAIISELTGKSIEELFPTK